MIVGQGPSFGKERPMVHVPTRGGVPVRLGPGVPITPGYGASTMSRQPYTDPMQFELEREKVLGTTWLLAARSSQPLGVGGFLLARNRRRPEHDVE